MSDNKTEDKETTQTVANCDKSVEKKADEGVAVADKTDKTDKKDEAVGLAKATDAGMVLLSKEDAEMVQVMIGNEKKKRADIEKRIMVTHKGHVTKEQIERLPYEALLIIDSTITKPVNMEASVGGASGSPVVERPSYLFADPSKEAKTKT